MAHSRTEWWLKHTGQVAHLPQDYSHCDDISDLDEDMLLDNPKVRAKRRYTEQKLREKMPKYRKSVYDTNWFIERINIAIKNEKNYCENEEELEHSVGSRVGILIQELRGEMV